MKLPKSKLIPLGILAMTVVVGVRKVKKLVSSWNRGISKSRKRIEEGNKPSSPKEAADRALWGHYKGPDECLTCADSRQHQECDP